MDSRKREKITIDCISDLHGSYPKLSSGDLLIVAGDLTARDTPYEYLAFDEWLSNQKYNCKIIIAGNHDGVAQTGICIQASGGYPKVVIPVISDRAIYLQDSGCEFEGLKIWGSPWTPTFYNWHFMRDRGAPIKEKWDLIPDDIDILITHGPPHGILDTATRPHGEYEHVGCMDLRNAVFQIKPKLHVFGHIHECGGQMINCETTQFVNASIMNEKYQAVNQPVRIVL